LDIVRREVKDDSMDQRPKQCLSGNRGAPVAGAAISPALAANEIETRATLLERSKRGFAPIPKSFVQDPDRKKTDRRAPLSVFVRNGDLRALRAFCLLHAVISSGAGDNGWSTTLSLRVWARAFDTTSSADKRSAVSAASKILTRLEQRRLIERARRGRERNVTVTLLRPDGSGLPYTRPGAGNDDRFLKLPNVYWTEGWYERLDLPATAMLLVALHEKPHFELATAHVPNWYGWSADTAERGLKTLANAGALEVEKRLKTAPLSPTGLAEVNVYSLKAPFEPSAPGQTDQEGRPPAVGPHKTPAAKKAAAKQ
jgi:hypothetical protein